MPQSEAALPETPAPSPRLRPLWFNRDYMLLWSGQAISSTGSGISGLAFPLLILALTHNAASAGFAAALRSTPYLFLSLPAGALIDRWNRKIVMMLCDTGRALVLGSIPVALALGRLTIWQIYVVALVEGTLFVLFDIAEVACLPRVVPKAQLPAATGQNQATAGISTLISQPIGGAIYSVGRMYPFIGDAVSYLVSVISLGFIKTPFQGERPPATEKRRLLAEIGEGLRWLWRKPLIRYMAFLTGSLNFVFGGSYLIIIVIALRMHATPFTIGLLGAIASIGGIIGSVLGSFIQKRFTFGQVIITTLILQAAVWPLQIFAPNPYVLGAIAGVVFLLGPIYNVVQFSYRVALIPDRLQGRVNSSFRLLAYGFMPLGAAIIGVLVQAYGTTTALVFTWGVFILAAAATIITPLVRNALPLAQAQTLE